MRGGGGRQIPTNKDSVALPGMLTKTLDYNEYLLSEEWQEKKQAVIEKYVSCVLCDSTKSLNVHHRHYRTLGHEDIDKDLTLLCEKCHRKFHAKAIRRKQETKKREQKEARREKANKVRAESIARLETKFSAPELKKFLWPETRKQYKQLHPLNATGRRRRHGVKRSNTEIDEAVKKTFHSFKRAKD